MSSGGSGHDPASSVGSSTHVATNGTTTNTAGAPFSTPEEVRLKQQLEAAQQKIAELKNEVLCLTGTLPTPPQPTRVGNHSAQIDALRSQLADLERQLAVSQRAESLKVASLNQQVIKLMAEVEGLRGMGQGPLNDGYDGHLEGSSRKRRYTSGNLHGMNLIDGELSSSDSEDELEGSDSGSELPMRDTWQGVSYNSSSDEDSDFSTGSLDTPISHRRIGASRQRLRRSGNRLASEARIHELTTDYEAKLQAAIASVKAEYDLSLQAMKAELEASAAANQRELQGQHQQDVAALHTGFQQKLHELKSNYEERLAGINERSSKQFERLNAQVKQFSEADQMQMEDRQSLGVELKAAHKKALEQIKESNTAALVQFQRIIDVQNTKIEQEKLAVRVLH